MKLYLIRHGQTGWNIEGKIQGRTDIPLNEKGIRQAELLAEAMRDRPVTALFSSPLKRAFETAEYISKNGKLPVTPVAELAEVDFGLWEGLTWEQIHVAYPGDFEGWDRNPTAYTPTGGETREHCKERCRRAMERILAESKGDIAIVAHGGILVFVVDYLLRMQQEKNEIIVKNASITTVEYDREAGRGVLLSLNDVTHLAALPATETNKYC